MNARFLVVLGIVAAAASAAHGQAASDLMPAAPKPTPGQVQLPYTQTLPGAPAPVVPTIVNGPPGTVEKAPPGRKGYDIYEPTTMFPGDERYGARVEIDRVPDTHVVKKGDTLWDIASYYFRNPWSWPKLWALNPSITNPHWIYPGDLVRLMPSGEAPGPAPASAIAPPRAKKNLRTDGILLRQTGFIEPDELKNAGKIIASKEEKILLGTLDEAYVEMNKSRPLRVGERYTIFRPLEDVKHPVSKKKLGTLVQILGEAEVKAVTDGNIARVQIVDATDPIERGYLVGALRRQFKMVEPVRNTRDLEGVVVIGLRPNRLVASESLMFIDKGKDDGVLVGNRFIVTRRGDGYQPILATGPVDDRRFPKEVIAEILIIDTRQSLATGLVTRSVKEARVGDRVELRKGY